MNIHRLNVFLTVWICSTGRNVTSQTADEDVPIYSACGGTITTQHGIITSPNYPDKYPKNLLCSWRINVQGVDKIEISFVLVDIETSRSCQYDYLSVKFRNKEEHKLCGNSSNERLLEGYMPTIVMFESDEQIESRGFSLFFQVIKETVSSPPVHAAVGLFKDQHIDKENPIIKTTPLIEVKADSFPTLKMESGHATSSPTVLDSHSDRGTSSTLLKPLAPMSTDQPTHTHSKRHSTIVQYTTDSNEDIVTKLENNSLPKKTGIKITSPRFSPPRNNHGWPLDSFDKTGEVKKTNHAFRKPFRGVKAYKNSTVSFNNKRKDQDKGRFPSPGVASLASVATIVVILMLALFLCKSSSQNKKIQPLKSSSAARNKGLSRENTASRVSVDSGITIEGINYPQKLQQKQTGTSFVTEKSSPTNIPPGHAAAERKANDTDENSFDFLTTNTPAIESDLTGDKNPAALCKSQDNLTSTKLDKSEISGRRRRRSLPQENFKKDQKEQNEAISLDANDSSVTSPRISRVSSLPQLSPLRAEMRRVEKHKRIRKLPPLSCFPAKYPGLISESGLSSISENLRAKTKVKGRKRRKAASRSNGTKIKTESTFCNNEWSLNNFNSQSSDYFPSWSAENYLKKLSSTETNSDLPEKVFQTSPQVSFQSDPAFCQHGFSQQQLKNEFANSNVCIQNGWTDQLTSN